MKRTFLFLTLSLLLPGAIHAQVEKVWTRMDLDRSGFTYKLGGSSTGLGLDWEHTLLLWTGANNAEFDIGPVFKLGDGKLVVSPELGVEVNMSTGSTNYIMPIVFVYFNSGQSHAQLWNFVFKGVHKTTSDTDFYYGRYFYKYDLTEGLTAGIQVEITYDLSDAQDGVLSMPVGMKADFGYGENRTMGFFVGMDSQAKNRATVARVSIIQSF